MYQYAGVLVSRAVLSLRREWWLHRRLRAARDRRRSNRNGLDSSAGQESLQRHPASVLVMRVQLKLRRHQSVKTAHRNWLWASTTLPGTSSRASYLSSCVALTKCLTLSRNRFELNQVIIIISSSSSSISFQEWIACTINNRPTMEKSHGTLVVCSKVVVSWRSEGKRVEIQNEMYEKLKQHCPSTIHAVLS